MRSNQLEYMFLMRLGLAALLGVVLGAEREARDKAAGVRTQAMVCMGAAAFGLLSVYGFHADGVVSRLDPSRVAAQVAVGVGFLGAGAIIVEQERIIGLTTAATIWLMAAVGLLVGCGLFIAAIGATLIALFVLEVVGVLILPLLIHREKAFFQVAARAGSNAVEGLEAVVLAARCTLIQIRSRVEDGQRETITLDIHGKRPLSQLVEAMCAVPGVVSVELRGHAEI